MKNNKMKELFEVANLLGSKKRIVLFTFLDRPMGYTKIKHEFKRHGVRIGSSEIYKHLEVLLKGKWIEKRKPLFETSKYARTKKSDALLKILKMR
jgi:predicted transcriptional regulator